MFYFRKAFLNIRRYWTKSLLAICTCMLIVVFLYLFFSGLKVNLAQLAALPEALPIEAQIRNLNGTLTSGMMIKESVIQALEDSEYVKDLSYTAEMAAVTGEVSEETAAEMGQGDMTFPKILGVNRVDALAGLPAEAFTFASDANAGMLEGAEPVCVIRQEDLDAQGLSVGDSIRMTLFYISYPYDNVMNKLYLLGVYDVRIIGSFRVPASDTETRSVQVMFPVKWLRAEQAKAGSLFFADSAHFQVANPLELNAFKAEMHVAGLMSIISEANGSQRGNALTVNDETFIKTAARLKENIALTQILTPFVVVIVGFLGFVASYLLLQSRRPEIAIMRSLGVSRKSCFGMLLFESAVLELSGSLAGVAAASFLVNMDATLGLGVVVPFFVVYMAGTAVALAMLGRFSVMQVLTALD
jgi:hypothetical protein